MLNFVSYYKIDIHILQVTLAQLYNYKKNQSNILLFITLMKILDNIQTSTLPVFLLNTTTYSIHGKNRLDDSAKL